MPLWRPLFFGGDLIAEERAKRKLTAIFSADVKGYSRLMGEDELFTIKTLKEYRQIIGNLVEAYHGRVVDSPGDNLLAEFGSVVDAVDCAVKIQRELRQKNTKLPEDRRMEFRIGVNLGDVVADGERIYGDGVNIAARVESLADVGGVCVSGSAFDQIGHKLPFGYEYLGEQEVKNIEKPVRVYRVLMEPEAAGSLLYRHRRDDPRHKRRTSMVTLLTLIAGVIVLAVWYLHFQGTGERIPIQKTESPYSYKPSIAVLPFTNISGASDQEYFSDGITQDLITDLSRFRQLLVIASNTVFAYKGKPASITDIEEQLGVKYLLEGSVQKANDKIRINVQLILVSTGTPIWAERYDRDMKELFDLQEEIVQKIIRSLAIKISEEELKRAKQKTTENLGAYEYFLRGWDLLRKRTREGMLEARNMFEKAKEIDPNYASAYFGLARSYLWEVEYGWTEFPNQALQRAHDFAQKGLSQNAAAADGHITLGQVYLRQGQYDLAMDELKQATELNPNDPSSLTAMGQILLYSGQTEKAIKPLELVMQLDPYFQIGAAMNLGLAYYLEGRYEDAIRVLKKALGRRSDFPGYHIVLAAAYAKSGRMKESQREAEIILQLEPFFELELYGSAFKNRADREAIIQGLRKAGLK